MIYYGSHAVSMKIFSFQVLTYVEVLSDKLF